MDAFGREATGGADQTLLDLPYDLYTRSKLAADFVNQLSSTYGKLRLLDIGGRSAELVRFLDPQIAFHLLDCREPGNAMDRRLAQRGKYLLGNALHAPFRDHSIDVVVCLDMLEHLKSTERTQAIGEMLRIGRRGVVIGCPVASVLTDDAERRLNDYFRYLMGRDHPWLEEHLAARPLPSQESIEEYLASQHLEFTKLASNNLLLWAQMQYLAITRERLGIDLEGVYRFCNSNSAALGDGIEPVYRYIYFIAQEAEYAQFLPLPTSRQHSPPSPQLLIRLADVLYHALAKATISALAAKDSPLRSLSAQWEEHERRIADLRFQLLAIHQTIGWRALEKVRRIRDRMLPSGTRRRKAYWALRRLGAVCLDEGFVACLKKSWREIPRALKGESGHIFRPPAEAQRDPNAQYAMWLQRHQLTPQDRAEIRRAIEAFGYRPLISILTPVYNTDPRWLAACIESVKAQYYPGWELCLCDDGSTRPETLAVLRDYDGADPRIKITYLPSNQGISGASNEALALAEGEFIGLLDHDDELHPDALYEVAKLLNDDGAADFIYTDEDKIDDNGQRCRPFFKPDWSPDLLLSLNYITHFSVIRKRLADEVGGFRKGLEGSQDYDLFLRAVERTDRIRHIAKPLYGWRESFGSTARLPEAKPFAHDAGRRAIEEALRRRGVCGTVEDGLAMPFRYRVRYVTAETPQVSIIVPTRDNKALLERCLRSIETRTTYPKFEILIVDNQSREPATLAYLTKSAHRVIRFNEVFNYSRVNNLGGRLAVGEILVFLNDDTEVISGEWLEAMVEHAARPEVGVVGAKLLYPNGTIQHAGVILGFGGFAGHAFWHLERDTPGYYDFARVVRNYSAVTGACLAVRKDVFEKVGGFDESFSIALGDIDLCLRIRERGYWIVWTPYALLYHHESASRGTLHPEDDERRFRERWKAAIERGDPYYNPNLSLTQFDFSLRL